MTEKDTFTYLEVEAALCIWEWINDVTLGDERYIIQDWKDLRDSVGSLEMRHASAITYAPWLLKVYDICTADKRDPFSCMSYDWEVVPLIMSRCLYEGLPALAADCLPEPADVARSLVAALDKQAWMRDVRRACKHLWEYEGLADDAATLFDSYFDAGDSPLVAAEQAGLDFDLSTLDPMTAQARGPFVPWYDPEQYTLPA